MTLEAQQNQTAGQLQAEVKTLLTRISEESMNAQMGSEPTLSGNYTPAHDGAKDTRTAVDMYLLNPQSILALSGSELALRLQDSTEENDIQSFLKILVDELSALPRGIMKQVSAHLRENYSIDLAIPDEQEIIVKQQAAYVKQATGMPFINALTAVRSAMNQWMQNNAGRRVTRQVIEDISLALAAPSLDAFLDDGLNA